MSSSCRTYFCIDCIPIFRLYSPGTVLDLCLRAIRRLDECKGETFDMSIIEHILYVLGELVGDDLLRTIRNSWLDKRNLAEFLRSCVPQESKRQEQSETVLNSVQPHLYGTAKVLEVMVKCIVRLLILRNL